MSVRPCLTLGVATDYCVALLRKKQAERCVGYALSFPAMQLSAPLPSDKHCIIHDFLGTVAIVKVIGVCIFSIF